MPVCTSIPPSANSRTVVPHGPGAPWAEEAAAAQDLGCGIGEPGQVVEVLLAHEILSVCIPDGERQPDPEVDLSPPCSAEAALGGVGDDRSPGLGVALKVPVPDASCLGKRQVAMPAQQSHLPTHARWTHQLVVDRRHGGNPEALKP